MSSASTLVFRRQQRILKICTVLFAPVAFFTRRLEWVVGVEDIASMATQISRALPRSYSVVRTRHPFYESVRYDAIIQKQNVREGTLREQWQRLYAGPVLLAWLINRSRGFVYVGAFGFLQHEHDDRAFEFSTLRRRGRRIVCYFTGNDIRSPKLSTARAEQTGRPNLGSILASVDPLFATDEYDDTRRRRARVADQYADAIFTAREDQLAYLERPTHPFLYFYPDENFAPPTSKFDAPERIIVVHAPSKTLLKGTPAVREAMERITREHPHVEYRELTGVTNDRVLAALDEAHIAVNQLYASMPGVFGIEAMARRCVMVASARSADEPDLGPDADHAWVHADAESLYDTLSDLIARPNELAEQARRGWDWARANASRSACSQRIAQTLTSLAQP